MQRDHQLLTLVWFLAFLPYVCSIDCYKCMSLDKELETCEDQFVKDLTTEPFIIRNCYYDLFKANYCVKLKGTKEDGSTIIVRQCTTENWGNHCGEIKYELDGGDRVENIDGCLESCDYDGCNSASRFPVSALFMTSIAMYHLLCS